MSFYGLSSPSSLDADDDASIIGRHKKIDDMRKRLEGKLAAMSGERELDKLRKQVADLRTSTSPKATPLKNNRRTSSGSQRDLKSPVRQSSSSELTPPTRNSDHSTRRRAPPGRKGSSMSSSSEQPQQNFFPHSSNSGDEFQHDEDNDGSRPQPPVSSASQRKLKTPSMTTPPKSNVTGANSKTKSLSDIIVVHDHKMVDPYGDKGRFTGEWSQEEEKPHGFGTMKYSDQRVFEGGWHYGQWHGKGLAIFSNGDQFDGTYDLDRRHGFGVYIWKDGRKYSGEFHCDLRQGCGEYTWPDGAMYRGEFIAGHRHGEGTYTFADGSTYTGEWHAGLYHGVGQCTWKDGRTYKGEWKQGKAHGYGVEKRANGTIRHDGQWNQDKPVRR